MDARLRLARRAYLSQRTVEAAETYINLLERIHAGEPEIADIQRVLITSTTHVTEIESRVFYRYASCEYEYGWWFGPLDVAQEMISLSTLPNIHRLAQFALSQGCSWLRLDVDADPLPNFPVYDW